MDDRALVAALVAGDQRGLEGAYRAYADRLFTYCRGVLRDPDAAADAVHDTFVLASQRAGQLREPDRLRSWLYAIARNECLRLLRGRRRQVPLVEAGEVSAPAEDPLAGLHAAQVQQLVWAAAESLNQGDREIFELAVRQELPALEISELLGVSVAHTHARLSRSRNQLARALGALLVARSGTAECPQLAELLRGWDGRLTALIRKRISRHIDNCDTCAERQRRQLRPAALFSAYAAAPMLAVPHELWPRLERTSFDPDQMTAREAVLARAGRFARGSGFPRQRARRRRQAVAGVAVVAAVVVLSLGAGALLSPPVEPAPAGLPTSPALSPPGAPAVTPTAPAGPTVSATPEPPRSPTPPPLPPPPPPPVPPTSPAPPAVALTAAGEWVGCTPGGSTYQLSVTVSAAVRLETAELYVEIESQPRATYPMAVLPDGTAEVVTNPHYGAPVRWWVVVDTTDGRSARTHQLVEQPCSPQ